MLVLGIHLPIVRWQSTVRVFDRTGQCGAAALIRDGMVIATFQGGLDGALNDFLAIPHNAIAACLKQAGISWHNIDAVVIDNSEDSMNTGYRNLVLENACLPNLDARALISDDFTNAFNVDIRSRLHFCNHVLAHVYSGLYARGDVDSLCICLDDAAFSGGGGIAEYIAGEIRPIVAWSEDQSLAHVLQFASDLLTLYGEKRMQRSEIGLAGDGRSYQHFFQRLVRFLPKGDFLISSEAEYLDAIQRTHFYTESVTFRTDIIASAYTMCCNILDHVLSYHLNQTDSCNVILTGNVVSSPIFASHLVNKFPRRQFFSPAWAADSGNAIGAALSQYSLLALPTEKDFATASEEKSLIHDSDHDRIVGQWKDALIVESLTDPEQTAADLLADGEIVAWMQGTPGFCAEPRVHWAIFADSRLDAREINKGEIIFDTLCVLDDVVKKYFADASAFSSLYHFNSGLTDVGMQCLGEGSLSSPSATALRVSVEEFPCLHRLMSHLRRISGVSAMRLANLENEFGEPLALQQVMPLLLGSSINAVVAGHYLIRSVEGLKLTQFANRLKLQLASGYQVACYTNANGKKTHAVEMCKRQVRHTYVRPISPELFTVLKCQDEERNLLTCCMLLGDTDESSMARLLQEILPFWRMKVIEVDMLN